MNGNKRNIVLIGMSGCGKTTVGIKLSQMLEMEFVDADLYVEQKAGMTVKEIFAKNGEPGFRALEKKACQELAQRRATVIATGGGAVKDEELMKLFDSALKVFIKRDIELIISTADKNVRPLFTDDNAVRRLYAERESLYLKYADIVVTNDSDIDGCVQSIIKQYR